MKQTKQITIICLLLATLTLLLFLPVAGYDFINFDDPDYVTQNSHVTTGLSLSGVIWAFQSSEASNWHPLTWLSHMLDCELFGLNAGGHHLTNVFFHVLNTLLLFLLLRQLTGTMWRSAFVAALFAWHPLHVESVAWVSERKDVLSTLFWILTMMAYAWHVSRPSRARYLLALALFALGLMCKPMLVTLPCVLLLMDFWPLKRLQPPWSTGDLAPDDSALTRVPFTRLIIEKIPFFALAFVSSFITFLVQKAGGAVSSLQTVPLDARAANALVSYLRYFSKTFWPADLSIIYPLPISWPITLVIASIVFIIVVTALVVAQIKRRPYLAVGWFWYLGTLVPTIGLIQVGVQSIADRYMYIPSVGLFIVITWGLHDLFSLWPAKRKVMIAAAGVAVASCFVLTSQHLEYWRAAEPLFRRAIQVTEGNSSAYICLGNALHQQGREEEALAAFCEAVRINPGSAEAQYNAGSLLLKLGKDQASIPYFNKALKIKPSFVNAHMSLAKALVGQGQWGEASNHLSKAIELRPDYPEAHYDLGTLLLRQSKKPEAIAQLSEALRLKPSYAEAHKNLGVAYMMEGMVAEGTNHLGQAVRFNPKDPEAYYNLGLALLDLNRPDQAETPLLEALSLNSNAPAIHYRLANAFERQQKSEQAIFHYRETLRLQPDYPGANSELEKLLKR